MIRLLLPMLAVKLRVDMSGKAVDERNNFRRSDRIVKAIKDKYGFACVVVIMEFYLNSRAGESARELIPRLTAINRLTDPLHSRSRLRPGGTGVSKRHQERRSQT